MSAPTRRKQSKRSTMLAFEALAIEGGLLSPEWFAKAAQLEAGQQSEADYRIPKGLNLRDEIGRYWRIAEAYWRDFEKGSVSGGDASKLAGSFVVSLLRESFGFVSLEPAEPVSIDGRTYPIGHAALAGRVPVVIAPAGIDMPAVAFGDGNRKRSGFGLAQEYLNAADNALWGVACDGFKLRILRDNSSLTRPAWIEVDLGRIFAEERYADFAALWLIAHETRFGRTDRPVAECALEAWRESGRAEGTRARQNLRGGVEGALVDLGNGFLAHPENTALRTALHDGTLTSDSYFQQLLRLVYRLIFLLTVEERGLLHPESASDEAKTLYADGYGMRRLRERAVRRSAHDRFSDLWEAVKIVFRGTAMGEPRLGLPALAGILAPSQCPDLDAAKLENRALLLAMFRLSWLKETTGLSRVNWRDMGPEELGSVYESLLELVPQVSADFRAFAFATGSETKGNARKTSGSYYTPDSLVQVLLDSALEPVVEQSIAANPDSPAEALLKLSIVDPACGSGHFLLAAARRIAAHVARLEANGTPSAAEYRSALRRVVGRCIYGVDLNPMAVELCKVSLWMEAVEPGLPLTFLDSHIRHGNALLGTTPELMAKGIPDAAWDPIEGDDKKVASALKKRNKKEASGQRAFDSLWESASRAESVAVVHAVSQLEAASDLDSASLAKKESEWAGILDSEAYRHQKLVADAWCAAFVWPKQPGQLADAAPTNERWRELRDGAKVVQPFTIRTTEALAKQYNFFHWHLALPQVFERGGFDVVLGNPPWEQVEFKAREFFAARSEEVARATTTAAQKKLIAGLAVSEPHLFAEYLAQERDAAAVRALLVASGRFPLCGHGRVNLFTLFAEAGASVLSTGASTRIGMILPSGIATDEAAKEFFSTVVMSGRLVSLHDFINGNLFPSVHSAYRFCLFCAAGTRWGGEAKYAFGLKSISERYERQFALLPEAFAVLNPNTRTCPVFRNSRDAETTLRIHRNTRVLALDTEANGGRWSLRTISMPNVADDSALFRTSLELSESDVSATDATRVEGNNNRLVRLYEAKMFTLYDHRAADVVVSRSAMTRLGQPVALSDDSHRDPFRYAQPRHWFPEARLKEIVRGKWDYKWFVGWRDLTSALNERTLVCAVLPWCCFGRNSIPPLWPGRSAEDIACLVATLSSYPVDYVARQKLGGLHMTVSLTRQLPVPPPSRFEDRCLWSPLHSLRDWLLPRVLELTYTAWDLQAFARDVGYDGPPFRWDPDRRFLLRAELDAAFFHLYGISGDDADYILETFPIVRKSEEKSHGEYRTKRVILEIFDEMAEAARTGVTYCTRLEPPPADPRVAHADTRDALK